MWFEDSGVDFSNPPLNPGQYGTVPYHIVRHGNQLANNREITPKVHNLGNPSKQDNYTCAWLNYFQLLQFPDNVIS